MSLSPLEAIREAIEVGEHAGLRMDWLARYASDLDGDIHPGLASEIRMMGWALASLTVHARAARTFCSLPPISKED